MRGNRAALLSALAAVLLTAHAVMASAGTTGNQRAAQDAAQSMLGALQLPTGAVPSATDPSRSGRLRSRSNYPMTPALVDLHKFWRIPGSPHAVLGWVQAHPPAGMQGNMSGSSAGPRGLITSWYGFGSTPTTGLSSRELVVTVASATGGGTAVRADAQAVWILARPASEVVPVGVTRVTIRVRRPGHRVSTPITLSAPSKVKRVAKLVNELPRFQPGAVACPADIGPLVELDFRRASGVPPVAIAIADGSGCGLVQFTLRGRHEPALAAGPGLIRELTALLGRPPV
jgi:hypothetical protein